MREPQVANAHTGWYRGKLLDLFQTALEDRVEEVGSRELFGWWERDGLAGGERKHSRNMVQLGDGFHGTTG